MTLGLPQLADGIGFVPIAMGLFAIGEIIRNLESPERRGVLDRKVTDLWPTVPLVLVLLPAIRRTRETAF